MARLRTGAVVHTSYGSGPYRIVAIDRDCTCPNYLDVLELGGEAALRSAPHVHLTCVDATAPLRARYSRRELRWLGGFIETDEGRVLNVWRDEELYVEDDRTGSGYAFAGFMRPAVDWLAGGS